MPRLPSRRTLLTTAGALAVIGGAAAVGLQSLGGMADYDAAVAAGRGPLASRPEMRDLIRYATLAANSHNSQPWRFRLFEERITIMPDPARRLPAVDPDDHHLWASLGCAAENLALAARSRGRGAEIRSGPQTVDPVTVAFGGAPAAEPDLFGAIPLRQSTRTDYDGRAVGTAELRALEAAAAVPGVDLVLVTDRPRIDRLRDLILAGNGVQLADPAFRSELKAWLRFNPRQAIATGDGLFSVLSGNPNVPTFLGSLLIDWFLTAAEENDKYARQIASSAGLAVFVAERDDPDHWMRAGRASQRFALKATALGLKHAFLNQPVEVARLRPELATLVGLAGRRPNIVMRFGHGPAMPYSARRPVETVLA